MASESGEMERSSSIMSWLTQSGTFLSAAQLKRLNEHKYSCVSDSLLEPHMQKWWNWVVQKLPLWLAPNLITIVGLMVNIVTSVILFYHSPDGKQEAPSYAPLLCAIGIFFYQTLDAIDGKQARRTGSSSPLGELFDHGCDSLSTVFVALAACITCGLGSEPWWMFFQCFSAFTLFYCAHWQTYVSGTLRFGKVDVTEAQFSIMALHMITFFFGRGIWDTPFLGWPVKYVATALIVVVTTYTFVFEYIFVILQGGAGRNGSTIALTWLGCSSVILPGAVTLITYTFIGASQMSVILGGGAGKNGSTVAGTSVLSPAIPLALVVVPAYIIACKSESHIFEQHPCLYILAFGIVTAKVTNRLVVAHMTRSEMNYLDSVLVGPALLFFNQYFNTFFCEYYVLWTCLILACWDLVGYCRCVCAEIANSLGIQVFRIVPKVTDSAASTAAASGSTNGSRNGRHKKS